MLQASSSHRAAEGGNHPSSIANSSSVTCKPDVLDIALRRAIPMATELTTHYEGFTKHSPILFEIGQEHSDEGTVDRRQTDWEQFRAGMQRICQPTPVIQNEVDLEAAVVCLETDIHIAL